jgi:hypothetical protein
MEVETYMWFCNTIAQDRRQSRHSPIIMNTLKGTKTTIKICHAKQCDFVECSFAVVGKASNEHYAEYCWDIMKLM